MKSLLSGLCILVAGAFVALPALAGGSIHNHLTLDVMPLAQSQNTPSGAGIGLSYDRYHERLNSSYTLTVEAITPYSTQFHRTDVLASLGLFTEITKPFSIGARVGTILNSPYGAAGFGAIALRLPALAPEDKAFMSFFHEEIDLGLSGSGDRYAAFRLAMTIL